MNESYLGHQLHELHEQGAVHTAKEITRQPKTWRKVWEKLSLERDRISSFLEKSTRNNPDIILTGAGSSAFIGEVLVSAFKRNMGLPTRAIPTTTLITHFEEYVHLNRPLLLISLARSGDSPESLGVKNLADGLCKEVFHIIISCNENGALARNTTDENSCVFILPPESEDEGLAMTNSFTSMGISAYLISRLSEIHALKSQIDSLADFGEHILAGYSSILEEIANLNFSRAVFLGSGPLEGIALESHLKLQELTDGKVICKHDSFLGFRHGPKATIDDHTLIIYLFTPSDYVYRYEKDLAQNIYENKMGCFVMGVFKSVRKSFPLDLTIEIDHNDSPIDNELLSFCYTLPTQILSFFKSISLGLHPDSPSVNGSISRVVQGVTIYPISKV